MRRESRVPDFVRRMIRDTKLTVAAGVALGIMFCLLALLIGAVGLLTGHNPFQANHVSVWTLLGAYLLAGALGGLIVGVALPLTRWMLGAALLAFVVAFIVWFVVGLSASDHGSLREIVHASAVLGAAFGLPIGIGFWIQDRIDKRTGKVW